MSNLRRLPTWIAKNPQKLDACSKSTLIPATGQDSKHLNQFELQYYQETHKLHRLGSLFAWLWPLTCTARCMHEDNIRLDGLLFSTNAHVLGVLSQIACRFSIEVEVCGNLESALNAVTHRRLDALVVDWNRAHFPNRVVCAARSSSPNSNATIVAVVDRGAETHALLSGVNFLVHKPLDLEHAEQCMRAAYGTMLQQRRRAARVKVDLPVVLRVIDGDQVAARINDVSVGGLALQCTQPLPLNRNVSAAFSLPGTDGSVYLCGTVVNADSEGRAGIRLSFISDEDRDLLQEWMANELAKLNKAEFPIGVANRRC